MSKILSPFLMLVLAGCVPPGGSLSGEQANLRHVQVGMSVQQVEEVMGTEGFYFRGESFARPMRVDRFSGKDGKAIVVYYYRSSMKRADDATSDDETTAVIFVDGKVDAVMAGDFAKQSIEVRFR